jgi:Icc-related predicted phosphoesterase
MRPGTLDSVISAIPRDIDVLVVAGDVSNSGSRLATFFGTLCAEFSNVIYVIGNHEYYNTSVECLHGIVNDLVDQHSNLFWLNNGTVTLDGVRFVGSTLWFPFQETNKKYERPMRDFGQIPGFRDWVYDENAKAQEFLSRTVTPDDVVVTHFLPSYRSVAPQYLGSPFNRFFACSMDDLIDEVQPKAWIHGHTHISCLYRAGKTQVVCNPLGYETAEEKSGFCPWLILEIET